MIGNIFKKNESTNKIGKKAGSIANLSPEDIATYITIEGESEIRSPLDKKLTIGREVGELVLSDKSISPRHCTFFKSNGVISIMDHSSENGTLINKKPLDPGKVFIREFKCSY